MKFFLAFCLIYSFTLFAGNQRKLNEAKKTIHETASRVDRGIKKSIKEIKQTLAKKKSQIPA